MKKMTLKYIIFLVLFTPGILLSQDVHFSQYNYAPLTLNPANTGAFNGDMRFTANYKNQWGQVSSPYRTYAFSSDFSLLKEKWKTGFLGLGLQFYNDRAGEAGMGTTQFNLSFSSIKKMSEYTNVAVGIQGGFAQKSLSSTGMTWDSQYDGMAYNPALPTGETSLASSVFYPDISAGILWSFAKGEMYTTANNALKASIGLAFFHANRPNQSFTGNTDRLYSKYIVHGGISMGIKNTTLSVIPGFMLAFQGSAKEIIIGSHFKYNLQEASKYTGYIKGRALYIGGHFRFKDALILSSFLELDKYAFGFSYDINISGLNQVTNGLGGLEITLRYTGLYGGDDAGRGRPMF
ncbi:MAG: PorP/SprF family type IX secretion system membrane protein [Bacteroidota bacterium]